jgi:hypothetical protein
MRRAVGRDRLDEPFLLARTDRNDDLVRGKGRKSVADGETDVRLAGNSIDRLAREVLGRAFGDLLRMIESFLVAGEPVEYALPYDGDNDLDGVGLPDVRAQDVVRMFDGADDEDVPAHDRKRIDWARPPASAVGNYPRVVHGDDGYFDERVAARYDESAAEMFDPAVIEPVVDLLAELAGGGRALELGIGTGRIALPLAE